MEDLLNDDRFKHVAKDPKFRRIPKSERKVKIDKRFQSMFTDKQFTVKYTVDKRGRPVSKTSTENLRKYYELSSSEESEDEAEEKSQKSKSISNKKGKKKNAKEESSSGSSDEDEANFSSKGKLLLIKPPNSDEESGNEVNEELEKGNKRQLEVRRENESKKLSTDLKKKLKDLSIDYARGEGALFSDSSSSDEESSEKDENDDEIEHQWGELDKDAESTEEATTRLAICNMDWDRIRAVDLMILLNSFLPKGGIIYSVTIYPSEFGLQRLQEEEEKGPIELVESKDEEKELESGDDGEEGSSYHMEKLRLYQLNRLKYYYAVVVCDSAETANKLYTECDGIEYESTSTKMDLRFIPDDMEFDQTPKEVCDKLPDLSKYTPRQFTTTALQQVKVELTWDENNLKRQEITAKINSGKLDEIDRNDLQAYLGSGSSDEEAEDEQPRAENSEDSEEEADKSNPIEKYKCLLKSIEDQEEAKRKQDVELEFTWGLGDKEKTEKLVNERLKEKEELTPFEKYLDKRKTKKKEKREERKQKGKGNLDSEDSDGVSDEESQDQDASDSERQNQAELDLLLMDETESEKKQQHFNMKNIEENESLSKSGKKRKMKKLKKKGQVEEEDSFQVDVADPRFNALFTSHHYNIDPANPHYRKTKGTEKIISEKLKRRAEKDESTSAAAEESVKAKRPKESTSKNAAELAALVKSVKRKAQNVSVPIK